MWAAQNVKADHMWPIGSKVYSESLILQHSGTQQKDSTKHKLNVTFIKYATRGVISLFTVLRNI
jgi:hypothetical protein